MLRAHDPATGGVRGILCFSCNNLLGDVQDDPARLREAAAYLDRHVDQLIRQRVTTLALSTPER